MPTEAALSNLFDEKGVSGLKRWGGTVQEELLADLQGTKGRAVYRRMIDDPVVGRLLFAIENTLQSAVGEDGNWEVQEGEGPRAEEFADFLRECMDDMSLTWADFTDRILTMLPYGWSFFETVYKRRKGAKADPASEYDDGKVGWRKLAFRDQNTLDRWVFDEHGGIHGMQQVDPSGGGYRLMADAGCPEDFAKPPGWKPCEWLLFRTKGVANPEGKSVLRTGYRPWYYRTNLEVTEAIGIERELVGIPWFTAPEGVDIFAGTEEANRYLAYAKKMVTTVRRDEQAGGISNFGWVMEVIRSGGKPAIDADTVIKRYEWQSVACVLAQFLELGRQKTGSFALAEAATTLFIDAIAGWLDKVAAVMNRFAVPRLFRWNGVDDPEALPRFVAPDVKSPHLADLAEPLAKLTEKALLTPDESLEDYLRRVGNLPEREESATEKSAIEEEDDLSLLPAEIVGAANANA